MNRCKELNVCRTVFNFFNSPLLKLLTAAAEQTDNRKKSVSALFKEIILLKDRKMKDFQSKSSQIPKVPVLEIIFPNKGGGGWCL